MAVPNLRRAKEAQAVAEAKGIYTLICHSCRKPLWQIKIDGVYGSRVAAEKTPFPNVEAYEEYWSKDGQPLKTECPFCGKDYFRAVPLPNGTLAAVPTVLELL